MSHGSAAAEPSPGRAADEALEVALQMALDGALETALDGAKREGRNRVAPGLRPPVVSSV